MKTEIDHCDHIICQLQLFSSEAMSSSIYGNKSQNIPDR